MVLDTQGMALGLRSGHSFFPLFASSQSNFTEPSPSNCWVMLLLSTFSVCVN